MSWLLFWASARKAGLAPIKSYTAEVNSAYDNSPLRSELTPHLRRPPEGGVDTHVIPVLMKQEGVSYFRDVIGHGRKQQRHLYYREAKAQIPNATNQRETEFTALTYKGEDLYVGTLPDLVLSNFLFQQCVMNRSPYVACYNWQVPYYQDELHVPPKKLIVIEDLGPKTEIATN
jgi:hypothetical protein